MAKRDDDGEHDKNHNQFKLGRDAKDTLIRNVKRIEKLMEDKADLQTDITDIFKEMKGMGFDATAIREVIAERKKKRKDSTKYEEREDMKDLYRLALGM